jgi:hypothetical protein
VQQRFDASAVSARDVSVELQACAVSAFVSTQYCVRADANHGKTEITRLDDSPLDHRHLRLLCDQR